MLGHVVSRLARRRTEADFVIATSSLPQDDIVEAFCAENNVVCFRGSEDNVLDRYVRCARQYSFAHVVRLTGDNPFPDVEEMDRLVSFHLKNGLQYSENISVLPVGVGAEIIEIGALEASFQKSTLPKHFEHVNEYILDNLGRFRHGVCLVPKSKQRPDVRLTVDTPEDYRCICYIVAKAAGREITTELAIALRQCFDAEAVMEEAKG